MLNIDSEGELHHATGCANRVFRYKGTQVIYSPCYEAFFALGRGTAESHGTFPWSFKNGDSQKTSYLPQHY
jgi:hypothetical protein